MAFKIIGTGPQFPGGYTGTASSAGAAITELVTKRKLCGHATVYDDSGSEVSESKLRLIKEQEDELHRSSLNGVN